MRERNANKWEHGDMFKHALKVQFLMNKQTGSQLSKIKDYSSDRYSSDCL